MPDEKIVRLSVVVPVKDTIREPEHVQNIIFTAVTTAGYSCLITGALAMPPAIANRPRLNYKPPTITVL